MNRPKTPEQRPEPDPEDDHLSCEDEQPEQENALEYIRETKAGTTTYRARGGVVWFVAVILGMLTVFIGLPIGFQIVMKTLQQAGFF